MPPSYPGFGPRKLDEAGRIHPAGKGAPVLRPRILLSKSAGHEKRAEFLGHGAETGPREAEPVEHAHGGFGDFLAALLIRGAAFVPGGTSALPDATGESGGER